MKKIIVVLVSLFGIQNLLNAQYAEIYPSNWWVGMKWNKVQLLIKGDYDAFNQEKIRINYPGVKIEKVNKYGNYFFHIKNLDFFGDQL